MYVYMCVRVCVCARVCVCVWVRVRACVRVCVWAHLMCANRNLDAILDWIHVTGNLVLLARLYERMCVCDTLCVVSQYSEA